MHGHEVVYIVNWLVFVIHVSLIAIATIVALTTLYFVLTIIATYSPFKIESLWTHQSLYLVKMHQVLHASGDTLEH